LSAVEFALAVPVLILMLAGTVDLGMFAYRQMQVDDAVQAGVRYAAINGWDEEKVTAAVAAATSWSAVQATPAPQRICGCISGTSITETSCAAGTRCGLNGPSPGGYVVVQARAEFAPLMPWHGMILPSVLTAQATVRVE